MRRGLSARSRAKHVQRYLSPTYIIIDRVKLINAPLIMLLERVSDCGSVSEERTLMSSRRRRQCPGCQSRWLAGNIRRFMIDERGGVLRRSRQIRAPGTDGASCRCAPDFLICARNYWVAGWLRGFAEDDLRCEPSSNSGSQNAASRVSGIIRVQLSVSLYRESNFIVAYVVSWVNWIFWIDFDE